MIKVASNASVRVSRYILESDGNWRAQTHKTLIHTTHNTHTHTHTHARTHAPCVYTPGHDIYTTHNTHTTHTTCVKMSPSLEA